MHKYRNFVSDFDPVEKLSRTTLFEFVSIIVFFGAGKCCLKSSRKHRITDFRESPVSNRTLNRIFATRWPIFTGVAILFLPSLKTVRFSRRSKSPKTKKRLSVSSPTSVDNIAVCTEHKIVYRSFSAAVSRVPSRRVQRFPSSNVNST